MKLLAEISDATLGIGGPEIMGETYELRKTARAVLRKPDGTIAVQFLKNHGFHKLPGGGAENGEDLTRALQRELQEEVGVSAHIQNCLGMVIEYRAQHKLIAISYCFVADVIGPVEEPHLEQAEIDEGVEHIWMHPEDAVQKLETDTHDRYQGPFIRARELAFLRTYLENKLG